VRAAHVRACDRADDRRNTPSIRVARRLEALLRRRHRAGSVRRRRHHRHGRRAGDARRPLGRKRLERAGGRLGLSIAACLAAYDDGAAEGLFVGGLFSEAGGALLVTDGRASMAAGDLRPGQPVLFVQGEAVVNGGDGLRCLAAAWCGSRRASPTA
jgi:hypothetical protein